MVNVYVTHQGQTHEELGITWAETMQIHGASKTSIRSDDCNFDLIRLQMLSNTTGGEIARLSTETLLVVPVKTEVEM